MTFYIQPFILIAIGAITSVAILLCEFFRPQLLRLRKRFAIWVLKHIYKEDL